MYRLIILTVALAAALGLHAEKFSYNFSDIPLAEALSIISEEHPEAPINFIYNEIESYRTSAKISTDNAFDAVREAVGMNPVAVTERNGAIYAEALQHGRYEYFGRVSDSARNPLERATVMFLAGKDSVMVTYAVTNSTGSFRIPCDRKNIIAKVSCVGYRTRYIDPTSFDMGNIVLIDHPIKLMEVTVKADDAYTTFDRTVYMPSSRQKNAAQDAVDLLRAMAIPQIIVGAQGGVSDVSGQAVKIFINSLPASEEQQKGLITADVRRVEYLKYPTDARYGGAPRVINFIVQEYEYGGYTKGSLSESALTSLQSSASVFSKFAYKKVTYDLYVGANNNDSRHNGKNTSADYLLTDSRGEQYHLLQEEQVDESRIRSNSYPVTLQSAYSTSKMQLVNTVGFTHSGTPENRYGGSLRYSDAPSRGYSYIRSNPNRSNTLSYSGFFNMSFPHGTTFSLSPMFRYTHRNDHSIYSTSQTTGIIDRHASENASLYMVNFNLSRQFSFKHSVSIYGGSYGDFSNLTYSGTETMRSSYSNVNGNLNLNYTLRLKSLRIAFSESNYFNRSQSNGIVETRFNPLARITVDYQINDKNSMWAMINRANQSYGINYRTTEILRISEFLYATGNPKVKSCPMYDLGLTYTWLPSSKFYINGLLFYHVKMRNRKDLYEPFDNGNAVLRSVTNDGKFFNTTISVQATLKLLDGKLQFNVNPQKEFYRVTGLNARSHNPVSVTAGANLFLDKWYFSAYYYSPQSVLDNSDNMIFRKRTNYWITAGWSNGMWNLRLAAVNMLNRGWRGNTSTIRTEYYSLRSVDNTTDYHHRLTLSVTYTIGYGKKVGRGNEVGEQGRASSAIIK